MIKKKRAKVTHEEKESIILASLEAECDIRKLAYRHQLVPSTVRRWRSAYKKVRGIAQVSKPSQAQFIELTAPTSGSKGKILQKVELQFEDYRCQIEGSLNIRQLVEIVQILGGSGC